jgi:hypothetical protein
MQFVEHGDAHPDALIIENNAARVDVDTLACRPGSSRLGLMRTYTRVVGAVQLLYAAFFGFKAVNLYIPGQFYHPEFHFKDLHVPAHLDYEWLILTTAIALVSCVAFIGGYGLLRLRRWVRGWQVAYLIIVSAGMAAQTVADLSKPTWTPEGLTQAVQFFTALTLPYVPFLFGVVGDEGGSSLPGKWKPSCESP